jgi:V/A-type H+-transporting ATPase subunit K
MFKAIDGMTLAIFGAACAAIFAGIGSAIGVQRAGKAAAGVLSEQPDLFGKLLLIQALPGTQGIYGFLVAILVMSRTGLLGGTLMEVTMTQGWGFFFACLPIAVVGLISGIMQGNVAASAVYLTAKQPGSSARGITMTALVETYAILALLISILLLYGI